MPNSEFKISSINETALGTTAFVSFYTVVGYDTDKPARTLLTSQVIEYPVDTSREEIEADLKIRLLQITPLEPIPEQT